MPTVSPDDRPTSARSLQSKIQSVRTWYHRIDLGGVQTPGIYDMDAVVDQYHLPDDLSATDVLDVGASNGFFSFLFERRGARRVVATELPSFPQHDYPAWFRDRELAKRSAEEMERVDWDELHGGFSVAKEALGSSVERVMCRVYDLPAACGESCFDLVFCSNVLVHLKSPVDALEAMWAVARPGGRAVLATPVVPEERPDQSAAAFIGEPELCAWWVPTPLGLTRWCSAAGFVNCEVVSQFEVPRHGGSGGADLVAVVHCEKPSSGAE